MKKIVLILLIFFMCFNTIFALEECTPSEDYLKYMELSDEEKKEYIEPAYCKELTEKEESTSFLASFFKSVTNIITANSLPSSYNALNDGLLTSPQSQGNLGTCWAFSSMSAVEANARKNNVGNYNFSEKHMIYSLLRAAYKDEAGKAGKYYTNEFQGGKATFAASYFFNNYGQLNENEWVYSDNGEKIYSNQYKKGNKTISLGGFSLSNVGDYGKCSDEEITFIKNQIINYGSIQSSMYMDENLFKDTNNDYYMATLSNSSLPNHGISIVGWDDSISASKFNASKNGAFIIKNSWGSSWSSDGYFYISYDDNFICKNTATFYDVSDEVFENTYTAADMLGIPTFMIENTYYIASKFNKITGNNEELKRISFPVGENLEYSVYLINGHDTSKLNSTSNWGAPLTTGTSNVYGIKSIDLTNKVLTDNFMIVIKYVVNSGQRSSVFTMCNNIEDTSLMSYSSNTNYLAPNLNNWIDMADLPVQGGNISCEPNIYVYTNNISSTPSEGTITINSITPASNSASNKKFTVSFTNNNVNTSSISYMITNSSNTNVTSHFTISPNYSTNKVTITSDGSLSGNYNFIIKYNSKEAKISFSLTESITPKDTTFININGSNLNINITSNYTLTYQKLLDGLNISNTSIQVLNPSGSIVSLNSATIGTNYKLKLNNKTYLIIIKGDINGDGKISALDYIEVRKHIMGSTISDTGKLQASDLDNNNKINALDYIAIRMILMR